MKSLVAGCLLLSLFTLACNQPHDCKQFRNGTFTVTCNDSVSIIVRNGDQQIEWSKKLNIAEPDTFKVKWINDCRYLLIPTKNFIKRNHIPRPDGVTTVDIVNISGNRCLISISSNFSNNVMDGRMVRDK